MRCVNHCFVLAVVCLALNCEAAQLSADPSNYAARAAALHPGDTLNLAAGTYSGDLTLSNLNGSSTAWITVQGPATGTPATFAADSSSNTVELVNCSYVAIRNLTLDGRHLSGPFGISAKNGTANRVHHILIENCTIQNYNGSQQTNGISTKTPTWNWTIRGNRILSPGTGLYLGNSDGTDPFIAGVIENNLIEYPIGYCMEIKQQNPWPSVPGIPTGTTSTIIRNNVFIKNDAPSPDGDRPNLLVDGFPDSGPGSLNRYEIYGNLFDHNPRESLLQVSGRVTIHDNIFVDVAGTALAAQNHVLTLKLCYVYNNTFYAAGKGIVFNSTASQGDAVTGNLVFAGTPISGSIAHLSNNITGSVASAATYVTAPSTTLGVMNFYPKPGFCTGPALSMSAFTSDTDYALDFNGMSKGSFIYRGAYAGSGTNPGWKLSAAIKPAPSKAPPTLLSGPTATPTAPQAGTAVQFFVSASDPHGESLRYAWLFGDGSSGTGASVSHVFAAAGTYRVQVTVTNTDGLSVTGAVSVTVSSAAPIAAAPTGTAPASGTADTGGGGSAETGGGSNPETTGFTLIHLQASLQPDGNHDKVVLTGVLPGVAAGLSPANQSLSITVNTLTADFTLDKTGRAVSTGGAATLKFKLTRTKQSKTPQFAGGNVPFTLHLQNGAFAAALGVDLTASVKSGSLPLNVSVQLNGVTYTAAATATYSTKANVGGTVKK